jgi:hypothetical protein
MDREMFDALARRLALVPSRRGVLRAGAGALVALTLPALARDRHPTAVAARKKKKKTVCHNGQTISVKKKAVKGHLAHGDTAGPCPAARPFTCPTGFESCGGERCCPPSAPTCCDPTTQDPEGSCAPPEQVCCESDEGGGSCPEDFPQCCLIALGEGCCLDEQDCCNTSEDCTAPQVCDDFGCCVDEEELQTDSITGTRRARGTRRRP